MFHRSARPHRPTRRTAPLGVSRTGIYVDTAHRHSTGTNRDRLGPGEALAACLEGDTLVVTKLRRALVMIHPFRDGNGRMARALQTMVLAQDQVVEPTSSSIEEWLGNNTQPARPPHAGPDDAPALQRGRDPVAQD